MTRFAVILTAAYYTIKFVKFVFAEIGKGTIEILQRAIRPQGETQPVLRA